MLYMIIGLVLGAFKKGFWSFLN